MQPIDAYLMYCAMKAHFDKSEMVNLKYQEIHSIKETTEFFLLNLLVSIKVNKIYKTTY